MKSKTVMFTGFSIMLALMIALIVLGLQLSPLQEILIGLEIGLLFLGLLVAYLAVRHAARAEAALRREKERAEVTLHSIGDGVITTDANGNVEYLNGVAESLTGWGVAEAAGQPLQVVYRVIEEETRKPVAYPAGVCPEPETSEPERRPIRLVHQDGREFPIEDLVTPLCDHDGNALGMVVVFHDVSRLHAMARQLSWQASHDTLTGLVNRREFERRLAELLETTKTQGKQHALLYMDLDKFKAVNDSCGHIAGDEMLRQLATAMQLKIRGSDTLARLGGDEFGVLLEACPLDQAMRIANSLRETVRDFRFEWDGKTFSVGVSIGLVPMDTESGTNAMVLSAADAACYAAKNKGPNQVHVYHRPTEGGYPEQQGDLPLVAQINQAFEQGNFRLYRQKIVPVSVQGREHYEVLVRMVDGMGNLISPTAFIPTAERYHLQSLLDRWVITTLTDFLAHEGDKVSRGGGAAGTVYAINLSGASINDSTFTDFLRKQLALHHVASASLCFEVTETTAISNLTKAAEMMQELKALGCKFALDDFGIGMSSFAYLKHLPVDFLKIDGTFIRDMARDPMDYAIVEAMNRIGHILGMRTMAECVEDAETLEKLRELKVDYAQGDFVGEPEPLLVRTQARPVPTSSRLSLK